MRAVMSRAVTAPLGRLLFGHGRCSPFSSNRGDELTVLTDRAQMPRFSSRVWCSSGNPVHHGAIPGTPIGHDWAT